jgi:hypothetical protein
LLLFTLTQAFAVYIITLNASQAQRGPDIATYEAAGADFQGQLVSSFVRSSAPEQAFLQIPGVIAAAAGFVEQVVPGDPVYGGSYTVVAVNPQSFRNVTQGIPGQNINAVLDRLDSASADAKQKIVPAVVDNVTWNALHLADGMTFSLHTPGIPQISAYVTFRVIGRVDLLPNIPVGQGGIMVNLREIDHVANASEFVNAMWLRTTDDPAQLANIRRQVSAGYYQLTPLVDRRAILAELAHEPVLDTLNGLTLVALIAPLVLALTAGYMSAWNLVRRRSADYAVLRALGTAPRQLTGVLLWEQGLIYALALVLGTLLGYLLAVMLVPTLVFTPVRADNTLAAGTNIYLLQNTPPPQTALSPLLFVEMGLFALGAALLLGYMVFLVARPSLGQALRLNED